MRFIGYADLIASGHAINADLLQSGSLGEDCYTDDQRKRIDALFEAFRTAPDELMVGECDS